MSFAASLDDGALEYSSEGLDGLLGQRSNVVSLRFWRMLRDIVRFYREAPRAAAARRLDETLTLGDYLDRNDYSDGLHRGSSAADGRGDLVDHGAADARLSAARLRPLLHAATACSTWPTGRSGAPWRAAAAAM